MPVLFPHARKHFSVSEQRFLATWFAWFQQHGPAGADPLVDGMPRLNMAASLVNLLGTPPVYFSLDVLCRMLVPPTYRNTMHVTNHFMTDNSELLEHTKVRNPATGHNVNGAKLTPHAVQLLKNMLDSGQQQLLPPFQPQSDQVFEADQDVESDAGPVVMVAMSDLEPDQEALSPQSNSQCPRPPSNYAELIDCFIDLIEQEPWQPCYRGKPCLGQTPVTGWTKRLQGYFWPNPAGNLAATVTTLGGITADLPAIVTAIMAPTPVPPATLANAVSVASQIFDWGGVPQIFSTTQVVAVVRSAASGHAVTGAPMNSGWTKLAAFATAHLPGQELAIWDSRVANSVIRRLDYLLSTAGITVIPPYLHNIGWVPGRGGSRRPGMSKHLKLPWPNGYRKWPCQFAGSEFIRGVAARLNARAMPIPPDAPAGLWPAGTQAGVWNVRMVEMVLFMDGY